MQLSSTQKIIAIALVAFIALFVITSRKSDKNRPNQTYSKEAYDTVYGTHVLTDGCQDANKTKMNLVEEAIDAVFDGEFRQAGKKLAFFNIFSSINCQNTSSNNFSSSQSIKDVPKKTKKSIYNLFSENTQTQYVNPKDIKRLNLDTKEKNGSFEYHLNDFPITNQTWTAYLNPDKVIPEKGFLALYFDIDNPSQIVQQQVTPNIEVNYNWSNTRNIATENFGGYWIGKLNVPQSGYYWLIVKKNWGDSRILIDNHIVLDKNNSNENGQVYLPAGTHIIEANFLNHTTTVNFEFKIQPLANLQPSTDISSKIQKIAKKYPNIQGQYGSVYGSVTQSILVNVDDSIRPNVLFLNSKKAVDWQIQQSPNSNLKAIIYGSDELGGSVKGALETQVINVGKSFADFQDGSYCYCKNGILQCKETQLFSDFVNILAEYKIPITRYEVADNADSLQPAKNQISPSQYKEIQDLRTKDFLLKKQQCS